MDTATLDDFMALNDEIGALVQAGVPLDVGLGKSGRDTPAALERINATVARRVSRGQSLSDALEDDQQSVPAAYRCLVQLGLRSGNLWSGLDRAQHFAAAVDESRYTVRSAFFYPVVICFLVYLGMVGFCGFFVPTLESMYQSFGISPGAGLYVLQAVRNAMPYWIAIPPVALLLWIGWRVGTNSPETMVVEPAAGRLAWIPGMSRGVFHERCANMAQSLAVLLDRGVPLEEGLRLAAGSSGDSRLNHAAQSVADALKNGQVPNDDSSAAQTFPPFLRWALLHSESTVGRGRALLMAADVYRKSAERRAGRLRITAPIITCVVLGGGVTLLYGLALFLPVVQMLRALGS